jgi:transposase InsO family protein
VSVADLSPEETTTTAPSPRRFATLKKELVNRRAWPSRLELQSAVFEHVETFYNRQRQHSTPDMLSPANYEQLRLSPLSG